eukprot:13124553-Alexandrium_andersonii.AAC.1
MMLGSASDWARDEWDARARARARTAFPRGGEGESVRAARNSSGAAVALRAACAFCAACAGN